MGKSALFNRMVGRRIAIVHDEPGVTRDRISAEAEWRGRPFTLVDTGGIGLLRKEKAEDVILNAALEQVELAIEAASVIIMVTNVQEGVTPLDREVAARLRRSGKPVLVAVNKVDDAKAEPAVVEFSELGFDKVLPVTAIHGQGIQELMQEAMALMPAPSPESVDATATTDGADQPTTPAPRLKTPKLAVVGRPNVGKSSIINALTQSKRVIVSPIPGTTRDSVDVPFEVETDGVRQSYVLIDTAGMRKQRQVNDDVEFYSVKRAEESIARSDIAILVLDAESGIMEQDKKIAAKIVEERKACVIVVNKWDLMAESVRKAQVEEMARRNSPDQRGSKRLITLSDFGEWVQELLFFLDYAPVIFTSAISGFHLDRLLEAVRYVEAQLRQQIPTSLLNRVLRDAMERQAPVSATGHFLKFFYATQVRQSPPTFLLFVNRDELFSDPYRKYLQREMRKAFGFEGCPLVLVPKARPKTIEPVRKHLKTQARDERGHKRRHAAR